MSRILVTGANGLVGKVLIEKLRRLGHEILATDVITDSDLNIQRLDVTERFKVYDAVSWADIVIHLAALVGGKPSEGFPWQFTYVNFLGTLNVLEAIREVNPDIKLIFMSSWATFGTDIELPITESTSQDPKNPYGVSKVHSERLIKLYTELYGMKAITFRPTMIYGPEQTEKTHVQQIVDCMEAEEIFEIWGEGTHTRELIYVDDMADILIKAIDHEAPEDYAVYVVGTENPLSVKETTKAGQSIVPFEIKYVPSSKWVFSQSSDMTKIKTEMGVDPTKFIDIRTGLELCLEFREAMKD